MMKKNSILAMLMVLIAALFGSSFVACSNGDSGSDDSEIPAESYVTAEYAGIGITFIPVSGSSTITENVDGHHVVNGYEVNFPEEPLDFDDITDPVSVKNRIHRSNSLYHNNDYIIIVYDVEGCPNELYRLEITDEDVAFTVVTAPESAR